MRVALGRSRSRSVDFALRWGICRRKSAVWYEIAAFGWLSDQSGSRRDVIGFWLFVDDTGLAREILALRSLEVGDRSLVGSTLGRRNVGVAPVSGSFAESWSFLGRGRVAADLPGLTSIVVIHELMGKTLDYRFIRGVVTIGMAGYDDLV